MFPFFFFVTSVAKQVVSRELPVKNSRYALANIVLLGLAEFIVFRKTNKANVFVGTKYKKIKSD